MAVRRVVLSAVVCSMLCVTSLWLAQAQQRPSAAPARIYNTAKQKLMAGKQLVGGTVSSPDPNIYCAMANAGFDYLWIEMQHSPLTYSDVAKMIWACRGAPAMPFIRVPDATESDIQKATDIGALGIIVPTVDTVEKAQAAVKWSKYPPEGRRSQGGGQYGALWGSDYRQTSNDNMVVVIMIETPIGVGVADKIAAVPGVDVIFAASTDLGNFSGYRQGDPQYEAMVTRIRDETLKAGRKLGGPLAWKDRQGFSFFQGPGETVLLMSGAQVTLGTAPAPGGRRGVAPAAVAADISGKWKAEVNTPNGQTRTFTFNFKVDGEKLTGTVARDPQDEGAIKDGKVKGDDISFYVEGPGGMATFKGKVSAVEIKFTAEFNGQSVEMTAKRLPK